MSEFAPQRRILSEGSTGNVSLDVRGYLDAGEKATGTPTVEEVDSNGDVVSPTDLSFTNIAVSVEELTIDGETVPTGEAIQFSVSGQLKSHGPYIVRATFSTDSTPAQSRKVKMRLIPETK